MIFLVKGGGQIKRGSPNVMQTSYKEPTNIDNAYYRTKT